MTNWTLEQKVQFSENQSTSKMSNTVIHITLKTVIISNSLLKKKKKRTMSGISRSRLLIRASGKMCRRTIQSEFLAWIKRNAGEQREKVLKLQKALEPFSCVKPSYITRLPATNGIPCSKVLFYGKKTNQKTKTFLADFINGERANNFLQTSVFKLIGFFFNYLILFCIFLPYPALLGTDLTQESKISSFRNSGSKFLVQTIRM